MKKNIFSVIITALTVINVVLTAIMFFVMLPTFQKTNNLITQVASVLHLELDSEDAEGAEEYTIKDLENVVVTFEETQTINLAVGSDGNQHYAMLDGYTLSVNKNAKDSEEVKETLEANQTQMTDIVRSVITSRTIDDVSESDIKAEALEQIQAKLDSKAVVEISLSGFIYQ